MKDRTHEERCAIVRAVIAEDEKQLAALELMEDEMIFYQSRARKAVEDVGRQGAKFKAYYELPIANPLLGMAATSSGVVFVAMLVGLYIYEHTTGTQPYPIYGAIIAIIGVATGWWVVGRTTHQITVRQNTNAMILSRFTHAPINDALNRFHHVFGYNPHAYVTPDRLAVLRESKDRSDFEASVAALYILNYLEVVAIGVINGDLNAAIVKQTLRGFVCYYYDKCEPYIRHARRINRRGFENLTKLRLAYREA